MTMIFLQDEPTVWTWSHFAFGLTYALVASLLFLFILLFLFKPRIKICPFICKTTSQFEGESTVYFFKIVNSSIFSGNDVKVELNVLERYPTPPTGMMNTRTIPLRLVSDHLCNIEPSRPKWIRKEANHCVRFRTKENLEEIVNNDFKSVEFKVYLRHGLTGLVKVFTQEYADNSLIKNAKHAYGPKFEVIN
ncbi:MAG TPA: hypothetical protein VG890_00685 [Puia sp.]|nr:hypothetical protein [Puia sp.]